MKRSPKKRITKKMVQEQEARPFAILTIEPKAEIESAPFDKGEMTLRQTKFVQAYIGPAGGDGSKAAEIAGYAAENRLSLAVTASRLLRRANIQRALGLAFAAQRNNPEWTTNRLIELASSNIANVCKMGDGGEISFSSQTAIENGAFGQIKELQEDVLKLPDGNCQIIKRKVKMHDPSTALATLLKMHGLIKEHLQHSGTIKLLPIRLDGGKTVNGHANNNRTTGITGALSEAG